MTNTGGLSNKTSNQNHVGSQIGPNDPINSDEVTKSEGIQTNLTSSMKVSYSCYLLI